MLPLENPYILERTTTPSAGGVNEIRVVNLTSPGPCGSDPIVRIEVFVYLGYVPVLTATFILGNHHGTCVHATLMAPQLAN